MIEQPEPLTEIPDGRQWRHREDNHIAGRRAHDGRIQQDVRALSARLFFKPLTQFILTPEKVDELLSGWGLSIIEVKYQARRQACGVGWTAAKGSLYTVGQGVLVPAASEDGEGQDAQVIAKAGQSIPHQVGMAVNALGKVFLLEVRPASDPARMAGTALRAAQRGTGNGNVCYDASPG